jgi:glycerophosphoryl diester phosphodiesterase
MVEFDVRRTADGEIIVHHDEAIGERALAEMEFAEALRRSNDLGYRIPRVSELLDVTSGRILLDIELKESGYEESLIRLVFARQFRVSDFAVTSFDALILERVRELNPEITIGLLVYDMTKEEALKRFDQVAANFLAPDYELLDDSFLDNARASRVPLLPWTVNDAAAIRMLLRAPAVVGVITDQPINALAIRNEEALRTLGPESLLWHKR